MAVSKRLRYEVLRRDNHTCKYCGGTAPDVTLTVDHVVPSTLGGSDEPSNLVAACKDCNAGKSASNPDAPLVAGVDEKAAQWALAMNRVIEERARELEDERKRFRKFDRKWKQYQCSSDGSPLPRDVNWKNSLSRFFAAGLDDQFVADAVDTAAGKQHIAARDTWKYFCGICWHEINDLIERTSSTLTEASQVAAPSAHPTNPFDYMSVFRAFLHNVVPALGGTEPIVQYVEGVLYDAVPDAHKEWTRVSDRMDYDETTGHVVDQFESQVAVHMAEVAGWRKLRDEFGRRFLAIALSYGGVPDSAIEIAQRCYTPAIDRAIQSYGDRARSVAEPHEQALEYAESDMFLVVIDAMLELEEQSEAIP